MDVLPRLVYETEHERNVWDQLKESVANTRLFRDLESPTRILVALCMAMFTRTASSWEDLCLRVERSEQGLYGPALAVLREYARLLGTESPAGGYLNCVELKTHDVTGHDRLVLFLRMASNTHKLNSDFIYGSQPGAPGDPDHASTDQRIRNHKFMLQYSNLQEAPVFEYAPRWPITDTRIFADTVCGVLSFMLDAKRWDAFFASGHGLHDVLSAPLFLQPLIAAVASEWYRKNDRENTHFQLGGWVLSRNGAERMFSENRSMSNMAYILDHDLFDFVTSLSRYNLVSPLNMQYKHPRYMDFNLLQKSTHPVPLTVSDDTLYTPLSFATFATITYIVNAVIGMARFDIPKHADLPHVRTELIERVVVIAYVAVYKLVRCVHSPKLYGEELKKTHERIMQVLGTCDHEWLLVNTLNFSAPTPPTERCCHMAAVSMDFGDNHFWTMVQTLVELNYIALYHPMPNSGCQNHPLFTLQRAVKRPDNTVIEAFRWFAGMNPRTDNDTHGTRWISASIRDRADRTTADELSVVRRGLPLQQQLPSSVMTVVMGSYDLDIGIESVAIVQHIQDALMEFRSSYCIKDTFFQLTPVLPGVGNHEMVRLKLLRKENSFEDQCLRYLLRDFTLDGHPTRVNTHHVLCPFSPLLQSMLLALWHQTEENFSGWTETSDAGNTLRNMAIMTIRDFRDTVGLGRRGTNNHRESFLGDKRKILGETACGRVLHHLVFIIPRVVSALGFGSSEEVIRFVCAARTYTKKYNPRENTDPRWELSVRDKNMFYALASLFYKNNDYIITATGRDALRTLLKIVLGKDNKHASYEMDLARMMAYLILGGTAKVGDLLDMWQGGNNEDIDCAEDVCQFPPNFTVAGDKINPDMVKMHKTHKKNIEFRSVARYFNEQTRFFERKTPKSQDIEDVLSSGQRIIAFGVACLDAMNAGDPNTLDTVLQMWGGLRKFKRVKTKQREDLVMPTFTERFRPDSWARNPATLDICNALQPDHDEMVLDESASGINSERLEQVSHDLGVFLRGCEFVTTTAFKSSRTKSAAWREAYRAIATPTLTVFYHNAVLSVFPSTPVAFTVDTHSEQPWIVRHDMIVPVKNELCPATNLLANFENLRLSTQSDANPVPNALDIMSTRPPRTVPAPMELEGEKKKAKSRKRPRESSSKKDTDDENTRQHKMRAVMPAPDTLRTELDLRVERMLAEQFPICTSLVSAELSTPQVSFDTDIGEHRVSYAKEILGTMSSFLEAKAQGEKDENSIDAKIRRMSSRQIEEIISPRARLPACLHCGRERADVCSICVNRRCTIPDTICLECAVLESPNVRPFLQGACNGCSQHINVFYSTRNRTRRELRDIINGRTVYFPLSEDMPNPPIVNSRWKRMLSQ